MSTRCNVVVVDVRTGDRTYLYHHCDGYPQGVGRELTSMLSRFRREVGERLIGSNERVRFIQQTDCAYELTAGVHGDIEYLYTLKVMPDQIVFYAEDAEGNDVMDEI